MFASSRCRGRNGKFLLDILQTKNINSMSQKGCLGIYRLYNCFHIFLLKKKPPSKEPGATTALQAAVAPSLLARVLMVAVGLTAMLYSELKLVARPVGFRREVWVSSSELWIHKLEKWLSVLVDGDVQQLPGWHQQMPGPPKKYIDPLKDCKIPFRECQHWNCDCRSFFSHHGKIGKAEGKCPTLLFFLIRCCIAPPKFYMEPEVHGFQKESPFEGLILLMGKILHHLGWLKPCK